MPHSIMNPSNRQDMSSPSEPKRWGSWVGSGKGGQSHDLASGTVQWLFCLLLLGCHFLKTGGTFKKEPLASCSPRRLSSCRCVSVSRQENGRGEPDMMVAANRARMHESQGHVTTAEAASQAGETRGCGGWGGGAELSQAPAGPSGSSRLLCMCFITEPDLGSYNKWFDDLK